LGGFAIDSASRVAIVEEAGAALQLLDHCLNFRQDTGIVGDTKRELAHPRRFGA
jgi:hypothetical protein